MTGDAPDLYVQALADIRRHAGLAATHAVALGAALTLRDRAVARAWRLRPGDVTWQDLAAEIAAGPVRLTVATLRKAEAQYRREAEGK